MRLSNSQAPFAVYKGEFDEIGTLLLNFAGAGLYEENPFRLLGAAVLDGNREITKRCDRLRLASELGYSDENPCFTPSAPPSEDRVREAARTLGDPRLRLLREFFWFWPLNYPFGKDDAGLAALKAGKREQAVEIWCQASVGDHPVALHNLAIYFHYLALEWEVSDVKQAFTSDSAWIPACRYWLRILGNDAFWDRVHQRVQESPDASSLPNAVRELRASLPDLLAKTGADLAMAAALRGNSARALKLAELAMGFHANAEDARRVLLLSADPMVRKLKARVDEYQALLQASPSKAIEASGALLRDSQEDLLVIQCFCGGNAERFSEFNQGLCVAVLDALVSYQRTNKDDSACLPLLLHLLDRAPTPELQGRTAKAFDVMYENALAGLAQAHKGKHQHARAYELIINLLLPADQLLDYDPKAKTAYRYRLGVMLKSLAEASSPASLPSEYARNALRIAESLAS